MFIIKRCSSLEEEEEKRLFTVHYMLIYWKFEISQYYEYDIHVWIYDLMIDWLMTHLIFKSI